MTEYGPWVLQSTDLLLRNVIKQIRRIFMFTAMKVSLWFEWLRRYKLFGKSVVLEVSQVTLPYIKYCYVHNSWDFSLVLTPVLDSLWLPKIALKWMPKQKRARGRPMKNWMEGIKKAMNERNLSEGKWEDRKQWSLGVGQRRKTFWTRYIHTYISFITMLTNTHHYYLPELIQSFSHHDIQFSKVYLIINLPSLSRSPSYLLLITTVLQQNWHEMKETAVCVA